jgi:sporulation protein YlmC with PRC-barrel domain
MPTIQESVEVEVPVRVAYDQWTQFEEFPRFMEGVKEVRQIDDTHLHWVAEIAGRELEWDAQIVEQEPERRIAWRSTGGVQNNGLVTFTPIDDDATRIDVAMEHEPESALEKAGDAAGLSQRRVADDLERFKELVESRGTATGAWRGEVHGGEVTDGPGEQAGTGVEADEPAPIGPEGYSESTRLPSLSRLRGMDVCTPEGDKVGTVSDVYLDSDAEYVRYLAVKTGRLRGGGGVVPVDDVRYVAEEDGDEYVVVPYTADQLRDAPTIDDDELTPERERAIYDYYERVGYWDAARYAVRARQTAPAPTPEIAEAEMADAIRRGEDPTGIRVKRWGA